MKTFSIAFLFQIIFLLPVVEGSNTIFNNSEAKSENGVTVTINTINCYQEPVDSVTVKLIGLEPPYDTITKLSDESGVAIFNDVETGTYDIKSFKAGYHKKNLSSVLVSDNYSADIEMQRKIYPVRNLYVDSLTSVVTWDEPFVMAFYSEGFDSLTFPPPGWQMESDGEGWYRSTISDGLFNNWIIPPWPGYYAITNHDYSTQNGTYDYLIISDLDLRDTNDFVLYFDSYFDAAHGGQASVDYSADNGATWQLLANIVADTVWKKERIDLFIISGENATESVDLRFHFEPGSGPLYDGWAIDNVEVHGGKAYLESYRLELSNGQIFYSPANEHSFVLDDLIYNDSYTISVQSEEACALSDPVYYSWLSRYLYPPANTHDDYVISTDVIPFRWSPPMSCVDTSGNACRNINGERNSWSKQFAWPMHTSIGETGVESDGHFIFTSHGFGNNFSMYKLDGTWIKDFTIPGVSNVCDLAFDGTYFYGAAADYNVYKMDFYNGTLVGTITAPVKVRAIAYNNDNHTFYANDWCTNITEFDENGMVISEFDTDGLGHVYGLAYDNFRNGSPKLWLYDQQYNRIYEMKLPDGNLTGVKVSISQKVGANGLAGGLFTQRGIVDGTVTIGGLVQSKKVWGLELSADTVCHIPDGLISYNVFFNGNVAGNISYNGEAINYEYLYTFFNQVPGTYCTQVSALYDLGSFGIPGETGESELTPCNNTKVVWGFDLPFLEDWDMGTFEYNDWTTDDTNWSVIPMVGDDAPSAQFEPETPVGNYESYLTSGYFNANDIKAGKIMFSFNLRLDDLVASGTEHFKVEVFDGESWNELWNVANQGSFTFEQGYKDFDISDFAIGKVFKIRFGVVGQNSANIVSWFIDNINIYRTCNPPFDIDGNYVWYDDYDYGVELSWYKPQVPEPIHEWVHWDNGEPYSDFGLSNGGDYSVAIRYEEGQLIEYDGTYITKLRYYLSTTDFVSIVLKIWTGENASNLIYQKIATPLSVAGEWNVVELDTPIQIDADKEYWIGYSILGQFEGSSPSSMDAGPHITGYADKILLDGEHWENSDDYGCVGNWNIGLFVEDIDYNRSNLEKKSLGLHETNERSFDDDILFLVYRSDYGPELGYDIIVGVPYEEGVDKYYYRDLYPDIMPWENYWYKVSALWINDGDTCESVFARAMYNHDVDYVTVLVTDVDDPKEEEIAVYPNPASDRLNIESTEAITQITVYDYSGKIVFKKNLNSKNEFALNTATFHAGVYITRIKTGSQEVFKRFVIVR